MWSESCARRAAGGGVLTAERPRRNAHAGVHGRSGFRGGRPAHIADDASNLQERATRTPAPSGAAPCSCGPAQGRWFGGLNGVQEGISQDLSEGGISNLQKELARAGRIVLGLEVDGRTVYVPAEIRHCRPMESGIVELGCCFLPSTNEEEATQHIANVASVQDAIGALLLQHNTEQLTQEERRTHQRAAYGANRVERPGGDQPDVCIRPRPVPRRHRLYHDGPRRAGTADADAAGQERRAVARAARVGAARRWRRGFMMWGRPSPGWRKNENPNENQT